MLLMEEEAPRYYCAGEIYSLQVICSTDPEAEHTATIARHDFLGIVLAYNTHSEASLDFVSELHQKICQISGRDSISVPTAVFALRSDAENQKQIAETLLTQGKTLARSWESFFAECPLTTGKAAVESFSYFAREAHRAEAEMTQVAGKPEQASLIQAVVHIAQSLEGP
jgi:hypothetical protein